MLHDELQARGGTCWLSPGGCGTPAAGAARARGVKVVFCVSRRALDSLWAGDPLSFAREEVSDTVREVLLVVDLDGELTGGWGGAEADRLRELIVADFSALVSGEADLEAEIAKELEGLVRRG